MKWEKLSEETVHENPRFTVTHDRFRIPNGYEGDYYFLTSNDVAVVVPLRADGKIVLLNQYRYLVDCNSIEFPMGRCEDTDGAVEVSAARELKEETGYQGTLREVGKYFPLNGTIRTTHHVFIATDLATGIASPEESEEFEEILLTPQELDARIAAGDITDGPTLASWALAKPHLHL